MINRRAPKGRGAVIDIKQKAANRQEGRDQEDVPAPVGRREGGDQQEGAKREGCVSRGDQHSTGGRKLIGARA